MEQHGERDEVRDGGEQRGAGHDGEQHDEVRDDGEQHDEGRDDGDHDVGHEGREDVSSQHERKGCDKDPS